MSKNIKKTINKNTRSSFYLNPLHPTVLLILTVHNLRVILYLKIEITVNTYFLQPTL